MELNRRAQEPPAALVQRILESDPDAEQELVRRYSRGVRFLLLELAKDPAKAEDLEQETFRLVLEKVRAGEVRQPESLPAFIRSLARNLFIAEYRKGSSQPVSGDPDAVGSFRDPSPGPLGRLLIKENTQIVRRLLVELEPPRDREILMRFFVAEHSKAEICADFGLSSLHFNRVLHRARSRLKKLVVGYHKRKNLPDYSDRLGESP